MEVLRRDAWPSGGTHPASQARHRHRTMAAQTSPVLLPHARTQDAVSLPSTNQQDGPLGDNTGMTDYSACADCSVSTKFGCQVWVKSKDYVLVNPLISSPKAGLSDF